MIDRDIAEAAGTDRSRIIAWRRRYGLAPNRRLLRRAPPKPKPPGPAISPLAEPLYARIARAVGDGVPPDIAADVRSEIFLAVSSGELSEGEIEAKAALYRARFVGQYASPFGPRSLDEPIGDDGWCLRDTIPDGWAASESRVVELSALARLLGIDVEAVLAAD